MFKSLINILRKNNMKIVELNYSSLVESRQELVINNQNLHKPVMVDEILNYLVKETEHFKVILLSLLNELDP